MAVTGPLTGRRDWSTDRGRESHDYKVSKSSPLRYQDAVAICHRLGVQPGRVRHLTCTGRLSKQKPNGESRAQRKAAQRLPPAPTPGSATHQGGCWLLTGSAPRKEAQKLLWRGTSIGVRLLHTNLPGRRDRIKPGWSGQSPAQTPVVGCPPRGAGILLQRSLPHASAGQTTQ